MKQQGFLLMFENTVRAEGESLTLVKGFIFPIEAVVDRRSCI